LADLLVASFIKDIVSIDIHITMMFFLKMRDLGGRYTVQTAWLCAFLGSIPAVSAQSLPEVVQRALLDYPALLAAQGRVEAARADIARARSQHYPQIGVSATSSHYGSGRPAGASTGVLTPTARLNLWSGGRIEAEARRAEALTRAAGHAQTATLDEVVLLVTEAYLNWARTTDLYQLAVRNVYAHQETLDDIQKISQVDTGRRIDYQQALVRMENANLALQQRKADMLQAIERVRRFWPAEMQGRPEPLEPLLAPGGPLGQMPATLAQAQAQLSDRLPAVARALADVEAAQHALEQAKGLRWPTVDLSSSRVNDPANPWRQTPLTQLQVSMPVYNGGQASAQIEAAVGQLRAAQATTEEVRLLAREKLALAFQEWMAARSRTGVGASQSEVGDQVVEGYRAQFRVGRRSLLDLLNIQADAFNYRSSARAAFHDERLARARVLAAMGQLAERFPTPGEVRSQR
jgi:outer membrane protein, adhesin transport system